MTPSARLAAAIDVFGHLAEMRIPTTEALRDWGRKNRYAGAKDRSAIASLVYDALRTRASSAWIMGADAPRDILLGALARARGMSVDDISGLCSGDRYAPAPLTEAERARIESASLDNAPAHVAGDFPEWLEPYFLRAFGDEAIAEGRALASRAPVDLRVNALKSTRDKAIEELDHLRPAATPFAPFGLRIAIGADGRGPALAAEPAYVKGLVEVQDESSQLAAALTRAAPGEQALDLCAGGGGKTLAMAAMMDNRGQIFATDTDGRRLAPIFERLERAGARNVQVRAPKGDKDILADLEGRCDLVLVDAPCTGIGTWRRNPDAKWRIRPGALEQRVKDQEKVLERAAVYVKDGGRLVYVTCSLLREENEDRIAAFLSAHRAFSALDMDEVVRRAGLEPLLGVAARGDHGLTLRPSRIGADGFFVCALRKG
ncbi:MAG: RsmB/NOP family class I SAM-dependent RNA methyltransferase [Hyphomicrobiales bacterium]|nr:RsmB/NOP family class I SAM-dependent RNA methyltransferase [Hyphomicrobiales bacterium]